MQEFKDKFGAVQVFESNDQFGSSVLIINPGKKITSHHHKKTKEVEVVLEGEVVCDGQIQKPGDVNIWPTNQVHSYENNSDQPVKILCITTPPYDPEDVFEAE